MAIKKQKKIVKGDKNPTGGVGQQGKEKGVTHVASQAIAQPR